MLHSPEVTDAVIYCRISDDPEGLAVGVTNQEEDCRDEAARRGWRLHPGRHLFVDNDKGASTRSKKRRTEYEAMMAGVADGTYDAILFYSNSRLTRRPMEYEAIIQLHERTGVRLGSVVSGDDDLGTADGRTMGRLKATIDAGEAERTSERVKRNFKGRLERDGRPLPVRRSFGFEKGGEVPVKDEAKHIRDAARRIIGGASIGDIVRLWNETGVPTVNGTPHWSAQVVKYTLCRPRVAGLLSRNVTRWDRSIGDNVTDLEILGPGNFTGILDVDTWNAMQEALDARAVAYRKGTYTGKVVHVLAGILHCGQCGHLMRVNALRDKMTGELRRDSFIVCPKRQGGCGQTKRNLFYTQKFIDTVIEKRLADMREYDPDADDNSVEAQMARLQATIDTTEAEIVSLRARWRAKDIHDDDFYPLLASFRADVEEAKQALREIKPRGRQIDMTGDLMTLWLSDDVDSRRAIMERLVERITLAPIGKVGPKRAAEMAFDPEVTKVTWRD